MNPKEFTACAVSNPVNAALLSRLPSLGLNQCYLTAGCLFQTVWNQHSGRAPDWGIKDYDVFYFDSDDLSWEAEDRIIRQADAVVGDLGITVEIRNQARVHLWYEQRFGGQYPRLGSVLEGIDRYLIACTCVGIEVSSGDLYAPNGLCELERGILRMNPLNPRPDLFRSKSEAYQKRWEWLRILDETALS
jgi:hypothetical protein